MPATFSKLAKNYGVPRSANMKIPSATMSCEFSASMGSFPVSLHLYDKDTKKKEWYPWHLPLVNCTFSEPETLGAGSYGLVIKMQVSPPILGLHKIAMKRVEIKDPTDLAELKVHEATSGGVAIKMRMIEVIHAWGGFHLNGSNQKVHYIYLVLPLYQTVDKPITDKKTRNIVARGVLAAAAIIAFVYGEAGLVHQDIKRENIFRVLAGTIVNNPTFNRLEDISGLILIGDFGLVASDEDCDLEDGTPGERCPITQILKLCDKGPKTDLFSGAVAALEIYLSGKCELLDSADGVEPFLLVDTNKKTISAYRSIFLLCKICNLSPIEIIKVENFIKSQDNVNKGGFKNMMQIGQDSKQQFEKMKKTLTDRADKIRKVLEDECPWRQELYKCLHPVPEDRISPYDLLFDQKSIFTDIIPTYTDIVAASKTAGLRSLPDFSAQSMSETQMHYEISTMSKKQKTSEKTALIQHLIANLCTKIRLSSGIMVKKEIVQDYKKILSRNDEAIESAKTKACQRKMEGGHILEVLIVNGRTGVYRPVDSSQASSPSKKLAKIVLNAGGGGASSSSSNVKAVAATPSYWEGIL